MTLRCQNCQAKIPEGKWGPHEAVEDGETDELVLHQTNPEDSVAVQQTDFYCDPECFVEAFNQSGGNGDD